MNKWIVYHTVDEKYGFVREEGTERTAFFHFSSYAENFRFDDGLIHVTVGEVATFPRKGDVLYCKIRIATEGPKAIAWVYEADRIFAENYEARRKFLKSRAKMALGKQAVCA